MKNIILSTDGTGNAGGKGYDTNVWRLHTAIDRQAHLTKKNNIRQVSYYHDGVGSQDKKWLKIMGGAFGYGLKRTIKELYTFLVNNYEQGDKIYLFGFSRGAYTVRLLAGMILACGLLKKNQYDNKSDVDLSEDVEQIYRLLQEEISYQKEKKRDKDNQSSGLMKATQKSVKKIKRRIYPLDKLPLDVDRTIEIAFMGVWDTVDAYAIPSDSLAKFLDKFFYISFREHDNELSQSVKSACQALSIDDQRRIFEPVLWRETPRSNDHQRIKQVWFSGVHANVGGGYPKQGLAWNTLEWMMLHAREAGLRFVAEDIYQFTENKDVNDKLYDSRSGFGALYILKQRIIDRLWDTYTSKESKPQVHISVFERIAIRTEGYAPNNLPKDFEIIVTKPICSEYADVENRANAYCVQYSKNDLKILKNQVSKALNSRPPPDKNITFSEMIKKFIYQWSAYIFLLGIILLWGIVFCSYEKNMRTFLLAIAISIAYWFVISRTSLKYNVERHRKDSTFWRTVSANKAWDFLRK